MSADEIIRFGEMTGVAIGALLEPSAHNMQVIDPGACSKCLNWPRVGVGCKVA